MAHQDNKMPLLNRPQLSGPALMLSALLWQTPGLALDMTLPQQTPLAMSMPTTSRQASTTIEVAQFDRNQWQLSEPEWQRYLSLMQGIRGSISPKSLSPLEVLGIHAETAQERKQYAKRWAQLMREDVERTLAFQRAYTEATLELYGKQPLFDENVLASLTAANKEMTNNANNPNVLHDGDRLLVFIKASACQQCNVIAGQALSLSAHKRVQVDFYFTDTREPQDNPLIIAWAKQQQLDPQRLAQKTLTLNHDKGTYLKVSQKLLADVPAIYLMRHDKLQKWAP
jgi:integrating conjugative element protein (TIGR03759 family)